MGSLFTFALGAVSALVLVPLFVSSKHRHRHRHSGPAVKPKGAAKAKGKGGGKRGK